LTTIANRLARAFPDDAKSWTEVRLDALRDNVLGDAKVRLRLLALIVTLVLLVTCVNVAGLLVSRHAARSQELTLRAALGARQGRLLRQLVVESAVLAIGGAVLGVIVAAFGLEALRRFAPAILPRIDEVHIGGNSLAFTVGVAAFATMLLGLLPARSALRLDIAGAFKRGSVGAPRTRMRHALVVVQFAFALCIVVGAGLLARSMMKLADVRLGLDPEGVATLRVFPPDRYAAPGAALELYRRMREEVAGVSGVQSAALVNHVPFSGGIMTTRIQTRATGNSAADASEEAIYRLVSPEYLSVMGGTLKRGRYLTDADVASVGSGIVVNEAFVKRFFGDVDALGQGVTFVKMAPTRSDLGTSLTGSVVGVVEDERIFGPAAPASPTIYVPYTWNAWPNIYVAVRTAMPAPTIIPPLRRAILGVDAEIPVSGSSPQTTFRPLTAYLDGSLESRRLSAWALSIFALVTVVLAGVGIFGVMAYLVLQSTREIGLRLALGSTPQAVRRWVLREALRLAGFGIAGGVVIALAGVRILRSQLGGLEGADPVVYLLAAAIFGMVALVAALLPAWRAARIDPMTMLRAD
jgi:predicted permease